MRWWKKCNKVELSVKIRQRKLPWRKLTFIDKLDHSSEQVIRVCRNVNKSVKKDYQSKSSILKQDVHQQSRNSKKTRNLKLLTKSSKSSHLPHWLHHRSFSSFFSHPFTYRQEKILNIRERYEWNGAALITIHGLKLQLKNCYSRK